MHQRLEDLSNIVPSVEGFLSIFPYYFFLFQRYRRVLNAQKIHRKSLPSLPLSWPAFTVPRLLLRLCQSFMYVLEKWHGRRGISSIWPWWATAGSLPPNQPRPWRMRTSSSGASDNCKKLSNCAVSNPGDWNVIRGSPNFLKELSFSEHAGVI